MQETLPLNNVPEFSVSELAFSLKKTLEETYGRVRVRGELGRLTFHGSGHMYGNIKDDKATIDVVCWRGTIGRLGLRPEEGLEVIATGKMSSYPARSNYQFIIEDMELAGEGALLKMLEQRKKQLAAEGLFSPERKKTLPFLPQKIGVITSPTGAVIRDILHRLRERFPVHVQLMPVRVQGDTAASEIVKALEDFERLTEKPDLLILARGGGSLEDLMPFNDEAVVRAVANASIPIISAVGHETDTTLADYAADIRAPTPTGAAEIAVPVRANLMAQVMDDAQRLYSSIRRRLDISAQRLSALRLPDPNALINIKSQGLDHESLKLQTGFERALSSRQDKLGRLSAALRHPKNIIEEKARLLSLYLGRLEALRPRLLKDKIRHLDSAARMLESLSYQSVLARGYVVVRDKETKKLISNPENIQSKQALELEFKDNKTFSVITEPK